MSGGIVYCSVFEQVHRYRNVKCYDSFTCWCVLMFLKCNKHTIKYLPALRELLTKICICIIPERQIIRPVLILQHVTSPQSWKLFKMNYIYNAVKETKLHSWVKSDFYCLLFPLSILRPPNECMRDADMYYVGWTPPFLY